MLMWMAQQGCLPFLMGSANSVFQEYQVLAIYVPL